MPHSQPYCVAVAEISLYSLCDAVTPAICVDMFVSSRDDQCEGIMAMKGKKMQLCGR